MRRHMMILLAGTSVLTLAAVPASAMFAGAHRVTAALAAQGPAPLAGPAARDRAAAAERRAGSGTWKANAVPANEALAEVRAPAVNPASVSEAAPVARVAGPSRIPVAERLDAARIVETDAEAVPVDAPPLAVESPAGAPIVAPPEPVVAKATAEDPGRALDTVPAAEAPTLVSQPVPQSLVALRSVYVADPGAPWFMSWYDETLGREGPLFSPDIEVAPTGDILADLSETPYAAALMPAAEFAAEFAASGAGENLVAAPSGVRVCAAFVTSAGGPIDQLGDAHLLPDGMPVAATPDTLSIARAVLEAYHVEDHVDLVEASADAAILGVSSGDLALAVTRVGDGEVVDLQGAWGLRVLELTHAMIRAGEARGLVEGHVGADMVQGLVPQLRIPALCDDIVVVTAAAAAFAPELLVRGGHDRRPVPDAGGAESGLLDRAGDAIGQLQSILWGGAEDATQ